MKKRSVFIASASLAGTAALSMQPASAWWGGPGYGRQRPG